jgi:sortase A
MPLARGRIGLLLLLGGTVFIALAFVTVAYSAWAEWSYAAHREAGPSDVLPENLLTPAQPSELSGVAQAPPKNSAEQQDPALAIQAESSAESDESVALQTGVLEPGPAVEPGSPKYGPPVWMTIPRIKVDSRIMSVGVKSGEYEVPAWEVGHHEGSADPGSGNSVYVGHLETIDAGRVFARLNDLAHGDAVFVYTPSHRTDWMVEEVTKVPNDDASFMEPTIDTRLTLYTCTGAFDPRTRDYIQRLVVTARLVNVRDRS